MSSGRRRLPAVRRPSSVVARSSPLVVRCPVPFVLTRPSSAHRFSGRRRPRDDENIAYFAVAGGGLVFDLRQSILAAHCTLPEHKDPANPCRVRRTCMPGRNDGQGRPCGFLMAWLADAGRHANRESHGKAARRLTDADRAALSHERRSAGRAELVAGASPALDFERPQRDGEPEEPLQIP